MFEAGRLLDALLGLGLESDDINVVQMSLRAVVVYVITVAMVRLGKKRFMGRASAFDVILGIMLGSIVSRAVTGNAPFAPALAATATLLSMHWLFSLLAMNWHPFGALVKGHPSQIARDGAWHAKAMRKAHLTEGDLLEDLRAKQVLEVDDVGEAWLERSGKISVIKKHHAPKVIEIKVENGVQLVRIEV